MAGDGTPDFDVVVVGGGHNGLVAAGYLARAGLRVRLLERLGQVGGAAVSAQAFDGVDLRVSRYSYLVSLLPPRIVDDLGAAVRLAPRRFSSYTPDPASGGRTGLLVGSPDAFAAIGAAGDEPGFDAFYRRCRLVTQRLWPTLLEPLAHPCAEPAGTSWKAIATRRAPGGPWWIGRSGTPSRRRWEAIWSAA